MKKRGAGAYMIPLGEDMAVSPAPDVDLIALDTALDALASIDDRKSRVIEMRFFGGMTVEETAEALGIPSATVRTRLFRARALLREALAKDIDSVTLDVFGFAGARCDRIVARVMSEIFPHS